MSASQAEPGQARLCASGAGAAATALVVDLFERYHEEIYGYLCSVLRDPAWAEDLAQETFVRALQARRRLPEVRNPRAWLYRVATNAALNALRRRRRFAWLPWRASDVPHHAPDVADQVAGHHELEAALGSLAPAYRASLLLYAQFGLSPAEVAEALGLSLAAARKRIYRATEMFRRAYEGGAR
jgi:RNA polymerase sigma-70 factor (ECF subfamily)